MICWMVYHKIEGCIGNIFQNYGKFVGKYPVIVLIMSIAMSCMLGIGLLNLRVETDVEKVYTPPNSQAVEDRSLLQDLFPDSSGSNFNAYSGVSANLFGSVIFRRKDSSNLLSLDIIHEIEMIYNSITANVLGNGMDYFQLCAINNSSCVVDGSIIFSDNFQQLLQAGRLTYPVLGKTNHLESVFGDVVVENGTLKSAKLIKLLLYLRQDTQEYAEDSKSWETAFIFFMQNVSSDSFDLAFAHSTSLDEELSENIKGDILLVSITFTLMIVYATMVTTSCDPLLDRQNLGRAGVIATGLGILAAFGLGSAFCVDFVSIVGVMPFLILGIGIDDMFILLAGLANAPLTDTIPNRVGNMMRTSGVAVTITSLTDMLAFGIGATSIFPGVRNFCIYTGLAIFFCYINFVTFFAACVAINERRMHDQRHCFTCRRIRLKDETDDESCPKQFCCGGTLPSSKEDFESVFERYPGKILSKFVTFLPVKVITMIFFAAYLGVSIYGATNFKQGFDITNLVADDSYFHEYSTLNQQYFPQRIPVSFTFTRNLQYSDPRTVSEITSLVNDVTSDKSMDNRLQINWFRSYRSSPFFNDSSEVQFVRNLKLFLVFNPRFQTDIIFEDSRDAIRASRIYVMTNDLKESTEQGEVMQRMREIATKSSKIAVTAFSPAFIFYELYVAIVYSTVKTVGMAVVAIFIVTSIFMPSPLLILYVTVTMAMIMTGICGFMYFWNLTLSSITMIHIIMSVGFSVDFSAHICHAFMTVEGHTRDTKVQNALMRAGGPILNGSVSSLLGILMLIFSQSYIFQSFFKVMFLVILIGMGHALFFLPVVLSLVGPLGNLQPSNTSSQDKFGSTPGFNNDTRKATDYIGSTVGNPV